MAEVRVVVDTNAWISYAFFRQRQSNLVKVVQGFLAHDFLCLASDHTLDELHEAMTRVGWASHSPLAYRLVFCRRVTKLPHGLVHQRSNGIPPAPSAIRRKRRSIETHLVA